MDVILEVADSFIFDRLYASILPIQTALPFDPISTLTAGFKGFDNDTYSQQLAASGIEYAVSAWQYKPSSEYFSVQPSEYAFMSRWDRDNMYRQFVSLYLMTWYVASRE